MTYKHTHLVPLAYMNGLQLIFGKWKDIERGDLPRADSVRGCGVTVISNTRWHPSYATAIIVSSMSISLQTAATVSSVM